MARSINLIVIHCSATPSGKSLQRGETGKPGSMSPAQVIDTWHAERGFKRGTAARQALNPTLASIGYHYVIDVTGEVWTGRGLDEIGAHAQDYNANSVGICMVGGVEREGTYSPKQWDSLAKVTQMLCAKYGIPASPPKRMLKDGGKWAIYGGVCGHRDLSPDKDGNGLVEPFEWLKTCPGFKTSDWLSMAMKPEPKNILQVAA